MNKQTKDKTKDTKIKEMVQHWLETAEQDAIMDYARFKMTQWYYTKGYEEVDDFYANHIKQLKKDMVEWLGPNLPPQG
tara:strand:+ start:375 stop:608 length:234 start_codon:yes stop_codon:yes gene_type:complete